MIKKTLSINLMFWTDLLNNSLRERNVFYIINETKKLSNFLSDYIDVTFNIFDYSPTAFLKEGFHIPYEPKAYERSKKINDILKNTNTDYFSIIDSDVFIYNQDYKKLGEELSSSETNNCFTFDVYDTNLEQSNKIIYENADPTTFECKSRFPGIAGGLGAFFITNTENLKKNGGFNEKFKTWGGEDGEIYEKIWKDNSIIKRRINNKIIRLYHLCHQRDLTCIKYFNEVEYKKNNNLE